MFFWLLTIANRKAIALRKRLQLPRAREATKYRVRKHVLYKLISLFFQMQTFLTGIQEYQGQLLPHLTEVIK